MYPNISAAIRCLVVCITLLCGFAVQSAEIADAVREMVRARVDGGKTMGMVIGVVDEHGAEYFSYGKMASSGNETPGEDSVFELGRFQRCSLLRCWLTPSGVVKSNTAIR